MATRLRLDHDLDPNSHRMLGSRGADAVISAGGDLTLGQGNGFRVTGAVTLQRISTSNWLQESAIDLQFPDGVTIANGAAGGSGFAGITTGTGEALTVAPGLIVRLVQFGSSWVVHLAGTFDDHKVIAVNGDNPDVLYQKIQVRYPLTETVGGTAPNQHVLLGVDLPSGPSPDPVDVSSKLYTARRNDAKLRAPCVGLLPHGEGVGFGSVWAPIAGMFVWQFSGAAGALVPYGGTLQAQDGDFIFAWSSVPYGPLEPQSYGLYEVVDCGYHWVPTPGHPETPTVVTSKPIIRRASTANTPAGLCHGMIVQVVGRGAVEHNGDFFTLDTSDPIVVDVTALSFSIASTYAPPSDTWALLAGPQLFTEGTSSFPTDVSATVASGDGVTFAEAPLSHVFPTILGTPGVDKLLKGLYGFNGEAVRITSSGAIPSDSITTLVAKLQDLDGGLGDILVAESAPLTPEVVAPVFFQKELASDYSFGVARRLLLQYYLRTNSTTPITLYLRYNSAARGTWVQLPFAMAVGGASDGVHNHLSGRDKDVASTDPTNADECHPFDAIGAGRPHPGGGYATLGTGGIVVFPAKRSRARMVEIASLTTLNGIDSTGFLDFDEVLLYLNSTPSNIYKLVDSATVAPPALPFSLDTLDGVGQELTCDAPATLRFWKDDNTMCFRLISRMQ